MKIFKTTIVSNNSCYVKTLLIIAEDKDAAHQMIVDSKKDKYNQNPTVQYKSPLTEISINDAKAGILEVGFASNDSDYESDD